MSTSTASAPVRRLLAAVCVACSVVAAHAPTATSAEPMVDDTIEITLLTKSRNAGGHPILRWRAVPRASSYLVVVQTKRGEPFWTWQGTETSVRLGGGPEAAGDDTEGAALVGQKVWFVVGFDSDRRAVASSAKRTISRSG